MAPPKHIPIDLKTVPEDPTSMATPNQNGTNGTDTVGIGIIKPRSEIERLKRVVTVTTADQKSIVSDQTVFGTFSFLATCDIRVEEGSMRNFKGTVTGLVWVFQTILVCVDLL